MRYDDWSLERLREEVEKRSISFSAKDGKKTLSARLRQSDRMSSGVPEEQAVDGAKTDWKREVGNIGVREVIGGGVESSLSRILQARAFNNLQVLGGNCDFGHRTWEYMNSIIGKYPDFVLLLKEFEDDINSLVSYPSGSDTE